MREINTNSTTGGERRRWREMCHAFLGNNRRIETNRTECYLKINPQLDKFLFLYTSQDNHDQKIPFESSQFSSSCTDMHSYPHITINSIIFWIIRNNHLESTWVQNHQSHTQLWSNHIKQENISIFEYLFGHRHVTFRHSGSESTFLPYLLDFCSTIKYGMFVYKTWIG